jgi:hypothetical protein
MTQAPEKLRPYEFHGITLDWKDKEWALGTCPFCLKNNHFFVKVEDGRMKCQRCMAEGNVYTFLAMLHETSFTKTTQQDYEKLAQWKGVSVESLRTFELAKSIITNEWIVPAHNTKGVLSNLYRYVNVAGDIWALRGTPTCKIHPFGLAEYRRQPAKSKLAVNEGLWDGCAMYDALTTHRDAGKGKLIKSSDPAKVLYASTAILAAPGANNFQLEWFEYLDGKEVDLLFDNDHPKLYPADHEKAGELMVVRGKHVRPGWDGMERIRSLLCKSAKQPIRLRTLHWHTDGGHNPDLPDGWDVRDHLTTHLPRDAEAKGVPRGFPLGLAGLLAMLKEVSFTSPTKAAAQEEPKVKPIERTSFDELCQDYEKVYHFTQNIKDTLAIMLAAILSTEAEKTNHLWLRVIGPPGSLKSTLAEAVSAAREWVMPKSVITGFHSGFVDPSGSGETASLIPKYNNHTVVMKDADTLSNSPNRDQILRELRDLYDGTSRSEYRNKTGDDFENIRMTFILCGTDSLRALNRTFLGERFLDCEIVSRDETDNGLYLKRSIKNTYASLLDGFQPIADEDKADAPEFIKQVTYGFIKYLKENLKTFPIPRLSSDRELHLEAMGQFVAKMRARLQKTDDPIYKPRTEFGTRICSQLTKMGFFLALVLGHDEYDDEIVRLLLKIVNDTSMGFQYEIVSQLASVHFADGKATNGFASLSIGLDQRELCSVIAAPETTTRRMLGDLLEFGIIKRQTEPNNSGQRGRDRHRWVLSPQMAALWANVYGLTNGLPTTAKGAKRGRRSKA